MLSPALADKLTALRGHLASMDSVLVAYSGGVDSSFLLKVASISSSRVMAVTALSPTYPNLEIKPARRLAQQMEVQHLVITTNEIYNPEFSANPPDRCYHCKKELFAILKELARQHDFKEVVEGTNADDSSDFRPGRKAAKEYGVKSPLLEALLTKNEIRQLARYMGLPNWSKPSMACLSSRIPYGQAITLHKLKQVAAAEAFLRKLGLKTIRVRHHGSLARIEVEPGDFDLLVSESARQGLLDYFHSLGFVYISLDLEGFRSGSMNAILTESPIHEAQEHFAEER